MTDQTKKELLDAPEGRSQGQSRPEEPRIVEPEESTGMLFWVELKNSQGQATKDDPPVERPAAIPEPEPAPEAVTDPEPPTIPPEPATPLIPQRPPQRRPGPLPATPILKVDATVGTLFGEPEEEEDATEGAAAMEGGLPEEPPPTAMVAVDTETVDAESTPGNGSGPPEATPTPAADRPPRLIAAEESEFSLADILAGRTPLTTDQTGMPWLVDPDSGEPVADPPRQPVAAPVADQPRQPATATPTVADEPEAVEEGEGFRINLDLLHAAGIEPNTTPNRGLEILLTTAGDSTLPNSEIIREPRESTERTPETIASDPGETALDTADTEAVAAAEEAAALATGEAIAAETGTVETDDAAVETTETGTVESDNAATERTEIESIETDGGGAETEAEATALAAKAEADAAAREAEVAAIRAEAEARLAQAIAEAEAAKVTAETEAAETARTQAEATATKAEAAAAITRAEAEATEAIAKAEAEAAAAKAEAARAIAKAEAARTEAETAAAIARAETEAAAAKAEARAAEMAAAAKTITTATPTGDDIEKAPEQAAEEPIDVPLIPAAETAIEAVSVNPVSRATEAMEMIREATLVARDVLESAEAAAIKIRDLSNSILVQVRPETPAATDAAPAATETMSTAEPEPVPATDETADPAMVVEPLDPEKVAKVVQMTAVAASETPRLVEETETTAEPPARDAGTAPSQSGARVISDRLETRPATEAMTPERVTAISRQVMTEMTVAPATVPVGTGIATPVESLGVGIFNLLGDAVGMVVHAGRRAAPKKRTAPAVKTPPVPKPVPARKKPATRTPTEFTARMGGRVAHGVKGVFTGAGSILVGGKEIVIGTVGCVTSTVDFFNEALFRKRNASADQPRKK